MSSPITMMFESLAISSAIAPEIASAMVGMSERALRCRVVTAVFAISYEPSSFNRLVFAATGTRQTVKSRHENIG
jgi:hypothetical protein